MAYSALRTLSLATFSRSRACDSEAERRLSGLHTRWTDMTLPALMLRKQCWECVRSCECVARTMATGGSRLLYYIEVVGVWPILRV